MTAMLIAALAMGAVSCKKEHSTKSTLCTGDCEVRVGKISQQGITYYQYGTHILTAKDNTQYVLYSNTVNLDKFIDKNVSALIKEADYTVEMGPKLYYVVTVVPTP